MREIRASVWWAILLAAALCGCHRSSEVRKQKYLATGKQYLQKHDYARAILEFKSAAQAAPNDPEAFYQLALAFAGSQDYTSAAASFQRVLKLNPKHVAAQLGIAEIFAHTNNPELLKDAKERLTALLASGSVTRDVLHTLALTELQLGDRESAIQRLEQILAQSPGDVTSSVMLARAKLEQRDLKGAEEVLKRAVTQAPKSPDTHRFLGGFYVSQHRLAEAEAQFRQALEVNAKSGIALIEFGDVELAMGRKEEAEQAYRQAAALDGYKHVFGVFLFQQGRKEEAIREFERLVKEAPGDRRARTLLVAAYRAANRPADAENVLNGALKKNSKDFDALLQRSEVFLEQRKYSEAEADLNRVMHAHATSAEVHYVMARLHQARQEDLSYRSELTEALRLNPDLLNIRLELAQSLIVTNGPAAAVDVLNAAPEPQRDSIPVIVQRNWAYWSAKEFAEMRKGVDEGLSRQKSTDLLLQDGLLKLESGNSAGAEAAFEQALKINPQDLRALAALSQTFAVEKRPPLAVQKLKEYAAGEPKSAPAQELLGLVLLANGERSQARAAFVASAAADPLFVRADLDLVRLDAMDGKWDDAKRRLEKVITADPANSRALQWLGEVEINQGNLNAAIEQFRKVVLNDPRNAPALNNLAYLLADYRKQPDEALKYAERAMELAPEDPHIADTLGWILYQKGLYDSAIPHLKRASSQLGVISKYHLAMAYAKAGQAADAQRTLDAALHLNSAVPEAHAALAVVQQAK